MNITMAIMIIKKNEKQGAKYREKKKRIEMKELKLKMPMHVPYINTNH